MKEGKTTILSFPLVCSSLKYFSCSHMKENLTLFTYNLYWAHKLSFSPCPRCPKSEVTCQFWASAASRESERGTNAEANINWTRQLLSSNTNTQHKYTTNTTQIQHICTNAEANILNEPDSGQLLSSYTNKHDVRLKYSTLNKTSKRYLASFKAY